MKTIDLADKTATEVTAYDTAKAMNDFRSLRDKIDNVLKDDGRTREQKKHDELLVESIRDRQNDAKAEALAKELSGQSEESLQAKRQAIAAAIINIANDYGISLASSAQGKGKTLDVDTIAEKLKPIVANMTENMKKAEILKQAGIEVNQVDGTSWKAAAEKVGLVTVIKKGPNANWGKASV